MAQYYNPPYGAPPPPSSSSSAQNLQFYPSSYTSGHVSGHTTPSQATYGGYGSPSTTASGYGGYGVGGAAAPFGAAAVSGRMGEQGGLRTGWLAAFGTEGYDGEPPLLQELGVNFEHIRTKVSKQAAATISPPHSPPFEIFPTIKHNTYDIPSLLDLLRRRSPSSTRSPRPHRTSWTTRTYMAPCYSSSSTAPFSPSAANSSTATSTASPSLAP